MESEKFDIRKDMLEVLITSLRVQNVKYIDGETYSGYFEDNIIDQTIDDKKWHII